MDHIMKYYLAIVCGALLITTSSYAEGDEYPKTKEERKMEEMGSILGGEGIVFHPGKVQNETTKTPDSKVNRYLLDASIAELSALAPLLINDRQNGVIATDWYSSKDNPNYTTKITVKVLSDVIAPEALSVVVQQRILKNGRWLEEEVNPGLVIELETNILRKSRDKYISSGR